MKKLIKKICLYLLIFSLINFMACYSSETVNKEKFLSESGTEPIYGVTIVKNDDERIIMDEVTYQVVEDTLYLEGISKSNNDYGKLINKKIALMDIQSVEIEELDEANTIGCIVSLAGLAILFIALLSAGSSHSQPKGCNVEGFNSK